MACLERYGQRFSGSLENSPMTVSSEKSRVDGAHADRLKDTVPCTSVDVSRAVIQYIPRPRIRHMLTPSLPSKSTVLTVCARSFRTFRVTDCTIYAARF